MKKAKKINRPSKEKPMPKSHKLTRKTVFISLVVLVFNARLIALSIESFQQDLLWTFYPFLLAGMALLVFLILKINLNIENRVNGLNKNKKAGYLPYIYEYFLKGTVYAIAIAISIPFSVYFEDSDHYKQSYKTQCEQDKKLSSFFYYGNFLRKKKKYNLAFEYHFNACKKDYMKSCNVAGMIFIKNRMNLVI